ncbi:MAG: GTPase ObgE, partial [bacterium]|nr:GTPase ObgE [bacterium]
MFIDERDLIVRAGNGGDGVVAFRREARIPRGGPAGGNGGRGGDVVLIADDQLTTFTDMQGTLHIRAAHGQPGRGKKQHGSKGADSEIRVPLGTSVYNAATGELLVDLAEPGQRYVVAVGGVGGKGNASFATAIDQTPRHATLGERTEEGRVRLHLRLLADVGLVGLPNAGKSTLLSRLSEARPRVADYPFTTLAPFLGIVELSGFRRFVMADLPGLIEGAHEGHGLGDRFLRHVERTRVLLHLVDPYPVDGSDPVENYKTIRGELE